MAPLVDAGLGAWEALSVRGTGRVAGVFTRAAYLEMPGGLVAVASPDVPAGPVHARSTAFSRAAFVRLRTGDAVVVAGSLLQAGPLLVDIGRVPLWRGALPKAGDLRAARAAAVGALAAAPPSALEDRRRSAAEHHVAAGDLAAAAACLGGAGPGLTPAGDDCLAGVLLVARAAWGEGAEQDLVAVAAEVPTNIIARAFLRWAARGQSIEPVHRFLACAVAGDAGGAAAALAAVTRFGHSSGADLALGLRMGLELLPAA